MNDVPSEQWNMQLFVKLRKYQVSLQIELTMECREKYDSGVLLRSWSRVRKSGSIYFC